ncbi:tryptophanyl-tRNA synthetase [Drechmeria coniospora]|uniref:Tryptophan--tRNA ligase, mitochondrial n=1 Tax=Drechmeria coniospora TaxID=98403 RepID=A0A151GFN7_DRECN|nr:tryptophanyl-tRNA synthetase [Drechmeria coniospora]KYK55908.1 tryptophanyl-tRNA synthetase [Drechmeria coniospora]ODA81504.1 hypothetical protein RJ55_00003 [Drechmeria coniospora]
MHRTIATASRVLSQSRVIFSGIQPTGVPHLGNYVGALRQWVQLQQQEEPDTKLIYSIVDLHAITTPQPPEKLKRCKRESLAALLALGIDPDRCMLFYQSSVSAHSELMWILACTASVGYLSRMTQWKQKLNVAPTTRVEERLVGSKLKLGLLSYPILQAADILVHRATHVPVGHDQHQHLEFARECATNFNHAYAPHLVRPETLTPPVQRIMSLTDPRSKMSKSHNSERSRILITDTPEQIRIKVASALTDSAPSISYDVSTRPGVSNLLQILSVFDTQKRSPQQLAEKYRETHPREFKAMVAKSIVQGLDGIRTRYHKLLNCDSAYLDDIEASGAQRARQNAEETMQLVRSAVGL